MRFPGKRRVSGWAKWCFNALTRPAVILLYHRVADLANDPQQLAVSPTHFEQQLQWIRQCFTPLSLSELTACAARGSIPKRAVALTFDDGYFDNLEFAIPLLEKYHIPATFYIVSGQVGCHEEFWWDELEAIFLTPNKLPADLTVTLSNTTLNWNLGAAAIYSQSDLRRYRDWNLASPDDPTQRHSIYRIVCERIRSAQMTERIKLLQELRSWAGTDGGARPSHRTMTVAELSLMARSPSCEVGAHTCQHPVLASLPRGEQCKEIQSSKDQLETILGKPLKSFSYPFGGRQHYTAETVDLVRQARFENACSNYFGWVRDFHTPFELPRFLVRDWTNEKLSHELKRHLFF